MNAAFAEAILDLISTNNLIILTGEQTLTALKNIAPNRLFEQRSFVTCTLAYNFVKPNQGRLDALNM
jgi:hypothetical protein